MQNEGHESGTARAPAAAAYGLRGGPALREAARGPAEKEWRFDRLVEQSPLSTQIFGPDGACRQVNSAWQRMWGAGVAEALRYNILEDQQLVDRGIMPLIRRAFGGESVNLPLIPYSPVQGDFAGQVRWCSAEMFPLKDAAGAVEEVMLVHNDLTERKQLEVELASALERWELAVNATQDGIWDWNPRTDELYWSPRCKQMLGYAADFVPTREWVRELLHPEDRESSWAHTQRHLAGEIPNFELEYRLRHRDGSYRWILARGVALRNAEGAPTRMIGAHTDVTDRKAAETALAQNQRRLQTLFENAQDAILLADDDGRYVDANPAACEMTGYTREELLRRSVFDLRPGDDRDAGVGLWREFIRSGRQGGEYSLSRKDGQSVWAEYRAVSNILPGLHLSILRDITKRKRAEEALRQAEERLRLGLKAGRIGTWDWDIPGNRVVWSEQIYAFHGLKPGEFGGSVDDFVRLVHDDDLARVNRVLETALKDGKGYEVEFRTVRPDGQVRWLSTAGHVHFDEQGRPVRMLGATTDITERRRTEQALRDSEERFRVALKNTAVSVYTNDTELRYTWVYNPRWGFSIDEVLGKQDGELLPMESISELVQMKRRVLASGQGERRQIQTRVGEQSYVFDATVEPLMGDDGRITGVTVASMDVTDVMNAKRAAEEASRAKDQFLAVLSHELRTPLTPVLLTLSLIESRHDLPDDVRADLTAIRRNVELESRLISDLLDLTRIAKGHLKLDIQDVDLHLVVRSAIDICQREASARLVTDLAATRHIVRGDSTRLQQIFWNLISNAQKFTPGGGRITVRSRDAGGGCIQVEVADTGAGIDPAVIPRLFDAFEQGEVRVDRQQAGLGLGLAISRRLVEAHGGAITATSPGRGKGSTFVIELPVQAAVFARAAPARRLPPTDGRSSPLSVLLIEDHEPTLRAMVRLLGQLGHSVTPVTSAAGALAAARQGEFDAIISDLGLPDGSGLDVMRQLKARYAGRAIALTGYGMESDVQASRDAGFTEHLTKPVDFETLEEAIRRVTGP